MIYFGKSNLILKRYRFFFRKILRPVTFEKAIPHIFIGMDFGYNRYYLGINRFKRIVKDKVYELDGIRYFKNEKGEYERKI